MVRFRGGTLATRVGEGVLATDEGCERGLRVVAAGVVLESLSTRLSWSSLSTRPNKSRDASLKDRTLWASALEGPRESVSAFGDALKASPGTETAGGNVALLPLTVPPSFSCWLSLALALHGFPCWLSLALVSHAFVELLDRTPRPSSVAWLGGDCSVTRLVPPL